MSMSCCFDPVRWNRVAVETPSFLATMATGAFGPRSRKTSRAATLISRSLTCLRRPIVAHDNVKSAARRDRHIALNSSNAATVIAVKVVPRAAKNEIVGWLEGALKVRVTAPPENGRANRALEELLAGALQLKKNAVTVTAGKSSARKHVAIAGLTRHEIVRRLTGLSAARIG